jgi:hypothetical protein
MNGRFLINRSEAKVMGVAAGLAVIPASIL